MIADADERLGRNGVEEIKQHAFFKGFDWEKVHKSEAPYKPTVTSEISNENFDNFDEEEPFYPEESKQSRKNGNRKLDMNFIGYTYKADVEEQRSQLVHVLKHLGTFQEENMVENDDNQKLSQNPLNSQSHQTF